ncbi:hypothetical protein AALP_AA2G233300 [Arabis alpina]|uniref:Acidic protein n=1 Tax=Arabis alpina TaxID=50452 RepID=A0A087HJG4_ARAAL|nr:hypothetical protein AALP_AA2G233300 [Arabis alpina]
MFMAQIQLGAAAVKICCPSVTSRYAFNICRIGGRSNKFCARISACKIVNEGNCPPDYPEDNLENSDDRVNEYCKLGCASSVCGAITSLQNFDKSEIVDGAVSQCTKTCSTLCTKGSTIAI